MADFTSSSEQPASRQRVRFSLRTLLLVIALAGFGVATWIGFGNLQRIQRIEAENNRFRAELGELEIKPGDEHKLHAIAASSLEPRTWKWRIYIPAGRQFYLSAVAGDIQPSGIFKPNFASSTMNLSASEFSLTVQLRRNESGIWAWRTQLYSPTSQPGTLTSNLSASPETTKVVESQSPSFAWSGLTRAQVSVEPGSNLQLIRLRMFPIPAGSTPPDQSGAGPGVLLWIHENKAEDANGMVPNPEPKPIIAND